MPKIAASERDAEQVSREIFNLLRAGALAGSVHRLQAFIASLSTPVSKFEGFANVNALPLSLADLELDVENALEDYGIRTVGKYRGTTEAFIRRIPGIGPKRFARLQAAIEAMIDQYVDWQIDGTIATPQPQPLPAGQQEPISPEQQTFLRSCIETRLKSNHHLCQSLNMPTPTWMTHETEAAQSVLPLLGE